MRFSRGEFQLVPRFSPCLLREFLCPPICQLRLGEAAQSEEGRGSGSGSVASRRPAISPKRGNGCHRERTCDVVATDVAAFPPPAPLFDRRRYRHPHSRLAEVVCSVASVTASTFMAVKSPSLPTPLQAMRNDHQRGPGIPSWSGRASVGVVGVGSGGYDNALKWDGQPVRRFARSSNEWLCAFM